jgi:F-type H+-transporting ATPase subunit delta
MKTSKEARKVSRDLFRASLINGRLDANRVRLIGKQVVDTKPRHYAGILKEYQRMIRLELAKRHARIESAVELSPDEREKLQSTLRTKHGQDLSTEFVVVPELLGGLRIQIGSSVFDSSVRERLNRFEAALA